MKHFTSAALVALVLVGSGFPVARAGPSGSCDFDACSVGNSSTGSGAGPQAGAVPADAGTRGDAPGHPSETQYMPACMQNNVTNDLGLLCVGATTSCPNPGEIRSWVYVSTWDPALQAYGRPVRQRVPPDVCLSFAQLAVVDPRLATAAAVQAQWQTFGVPAAVVVTQPAGQTLAGAVTRLTTSTPPVAVLPTRTVLGLPVTVTVTAVSYLWDFGDGTGLTMPAGTPPHAEHLYRVLGAMRPSLRTIYRGTFTIAGSPQVITLTGTADVPGTPTQLLVRQARTQLEAGPS